MLSEEIGGCVIGLDPAFFGQETVDFVGKDELLKIDALFTQSFDERDSLVEGNVAIVIAVDQQNGRAPGADGGEWRGLEG